MKNLLDVVVIGAGQAGLSASYFLKQRGLHHIVLERGGIGESWRSQRWDNFRMNTTDRLNVLPGTAVQGADVFGTAGSLVQSMEDYVLARDLPIETGMTVTSVTKNPDTSGFVVHGERKGNMHRYHCNQLIIASGGQSRKNTSPLSQQIDPDICQLHSSEYRNERALRPGGVLVVGSGQSGCQIAEELVDAGRKVYLSTSMVPRCPRHYRGKDIMDWLIAMGFFNARPEDLKDPSMLRMRVPLLKGTDDGKQSLSLQALAKKGVMLLGKMTGASAALAHFSDDVLEKLAFADGFSLQARSMIDGFISSRELAAPDREPDPDDAPHTPADFATVISTLNFSDHNIATIIWANGFTFDLDYLQLPAFDNKGYPLHQHGTSVIAGLYFLGLHWQINRKSDILFGIPEDARLICDQVYRRHNEALAIAAQ